MKQEQYYRELILRHNSSPISFCEMENYHVKVIADNPSCGDHYELYFQEEDGKIKAISFVGEGCAISKASTSMLVENLSNMDITEFQDFYKQFTTIFKEEPTEVTSDLAAFEGVKYMPARINCALLSWNALMKFLIQEKKNDGQ